MRNRVSIALIVCLFVAGPAALDAAEIDVLSFTAFADVTAADGSSTVGTNVVTNPLNDEYFAAFANSTARTVVSVLWDMSGHLDYQVMGNHSCEGRQTSSVLCRTVGTIKFVPPVDSLLVTSGEYNYSFAPGSRQAILRVTVGASTSPQLVLNDTEQRISIIDPSAGRITYESELALMAGVEYTLLYRLQSDSAFGIPTDLSTGDGFLHFQITPIPEPHTGLLMVLARVVVITRRRIRNESDLGAHRLRGWGRNDADSESGVRRISAIASRSYRRAVTTKVMGHPASSRSRTAS